MYGIGARFSNAHGVTLGEYSSKIAGKEDKTRDKITSVLEDCIRSIEQKDSQVIQFTTISLEVITKIISDMSDQNGNKVNIQTLMKNQDETTLHYFACKLNSNASTEHKHTECDITYTLIGVPRQSHEPDVKFCFQILPSKELIIKMDVGTTFIFSAYILTHHQVCSKFIKNGNLNVSAYSPRRVSDCFYQTFLRLNKKKIK